jgi:hypothetical protein
MLQLVVLCLVLVLSSSASAADIDYQTVKLELFFDNDLDDDKPCESPDNYTLTFKDMQLGSGACLTKLFPSIQPEDNVVKWMQFSVKGEVRPDGGLRIWLYFTRNEDTGAITYCAEQNIMGLPYPLDIGPKHNQECIVIDLPNLDPYASEEEGTSMAVRVEFDEAAVAQIAASRPSAST